MKQDWQPFSLGVLENINLNVNLYKWNIILYLSNMEA
jgi:hypothetical protein